MFGKNGLLMIGIAALAGGPGLFVAQSFATADETRPVVPQRTPEQEFEERLVDGSRNALSGETQKIVDTAVQLFEIGDRESAEGWIRFGAADRKIPALMLFYGDYLRSFNTRSGFVRAIEWYDRAERMPESRNKPEFFAALQERRKEALKGARDAKK